VSSERSGVAVGDGVDVGVGVSERVFVGVGVFVGVVVGVFVGVLVGVNVGVGVGAVVDSGAENSDVLPLAFVAVAVMNASLSGPGKLHCPLPLAVVLPRYVRPSSTASV
jgi:hypothetical protein